MCTRIEMVRTAVNINVEHVALDELGIRDKSRLEKYLRLSDTWMAPALSQRKDLSQFAEKILRHGVAAIAVQANGTDVGMVAFYCNDVIRGRAYITHLAVDPEYRRCGLGKKLTEYAIQYSQSRGMNSIALEVGRSNESAKRLYASCGFVESETQSGEINSLSSICMSRALSQN